MKQTLSQRCNESLRKEQTGVVLGIHHKADGFYINLFSYKGQFYTTALYAAVLIWGQRSQFSCYKLALPQPQEQLPQFRVATTH